MSQWVYSLQTGSGRKGLTTAGKAKKEVAESEVVEEGLVRVSSFVLLSLRPILDHIPMFTGSWV